MATKAELEKYIARQLWLGKKHHVAMQLVTDKQIAALYRETAGKIANLILQYDAEVLKPAISKVNSERMRILLARLSNKVTRIIEKHGIDSVKMGMKDTVGVLQIYKKGLKQIYHAEIIRSVFEKIRKSTIRAYLTPLDGIELSSRVWDIHQTTLLKIRRHIATSYLQGKYPNQIAQEIKRFLIIPDSDMRTKYWRAFFKENPPGRGVYRSAYKNSQRVLRTESNRAYRMGQAAYAKNRKWIIGVKWMRVAGAVECPECDDYATSDFGLGEGVFPPDSIPVSHPHCLCYLINVPAPYTFNEPKLEKIAVPA
jgi:hypothetical protein